MTAQGAEGGADERHDQQRDGAVAGPADAVLEVVLVAQVRRDDDGARLAGGADAVAGGLLRPGDVVGQQRDRQGGEQRHQDGRGGHGAGGGQQGLPGRAEDAGAGVAVGQAGCHGVHGHGDGQRGQHEAGEHQVVRDDDGSAVQGVGGCLGRVVDAEGRQRVEHPGGQRSDAQRRRQDPAGELDAAGGQDEQPGHVAGEDQQDTFSTNHHRGRIFWLHRDVLINILIIRYLS